MNERGNSDRNKKIKHVLFWFYCENEKWMGVSDESYGRQCQTNRISGVLSSNKHATPPFAFGSSLSLYLSGPGPIFYLFALAFPPTFCLGNFFPEPHSFTYVFSKKFKIHICIEQSLYSSIEKCFFFFNIFELINTKSIKSERRNFLFLSYFFFLTT